MSDEDDDKAAKQAQFDPHVVEGAGHDHPSQCEGVEAQVGKDVCEKLQHVGQLGNSFEAPVLDDAEDQDEGGACEYELEADCVSGGLVDPAHEIDDRSGVEDRGEVEIAADHEEDPSDVRPIAANISEQREGEVEDADHEGKFEENVVVELLKDWIFDFMPICFRRVHEEFRAIGGVFDCRVFFGEILIDGVFGAHEIVGFADGEIMDERDFPHRVVGGEFDAEEIRRDDAPNDAALA